MRNPEVIVTAGGTREYIDDVRYIGNFSGGRLGVAIANAYALAGRAVTLLAPEETVQRFKVHESINHMAFRTSAELEENIHFVESAQIVYHAAAVSDYIPERVDGKIDSSLDTLSITLRRNRKILPTLRDHFGEDTTLVGFKLLSNVDETELREAALKQLDTAKTDYCFANDLQHIRGIRRAILFGKGTTAESRLEGPTRKIALDLLKQVQIRVKV